MERMKLTAKNESCSVNHVSHNNKILDKDGKRETEKRILRERLLARLLHQKQLEKEVIKDMALQWGKNYKPSENLEAANESISECRNGRILGEDQRRELEKRVIGEELLSSWLHDKELEEEVVTELFCADTKLRRGVQCPVCSNGQDWNDQNPGNHTDGGLTGSLPIQRSLRAPNTNPEMLIGLGNGTMTPLGPISLNDQDWNNQSPGNHMDGGLAGRVPIQRFLRAPNDTNPKMLNSLGKGAMMPGKSEGSAWVTYVQGPISLNGQDWNDQRPGNHTDGGLAGCVPIQPFLRAQSITSPEMLIGLGKGAMTPVRIEGSALVPYVKDLISLHGQDWNDQRPGNHTDSGLTGSLPFQRSPRAPKNTNPKMLIGLGKKAMTPLVSSVKECASQREDKVDTLFTGGDDETAGKMSTKRKRWECDLCNVIADTESVLKEHLNGKRHFAKQKASR